MFFITCTASITRSLRNAQASAIPLNTLSPYRTTFCSICTALYGDMSPASTLPRMWFITAR